MRMGRYWGPRYPRVNLLETLSDRINYEESMMVRLSVSKREKGRRKRASIMSSQLHSLTHFSDISALTEGAPHLDEVRLGHGGGRQLCGALCSELERGWC